MTEMLGNAIIGLCLVSIAGLVMFGCHKAEQMMQAEAARAQLRASTAAAMRYDKHLAKLRRQKMRVQYMRRARVW